MISNKVKPNMVNILDAWGCGGYALLRNTERTGGTQVNYIPNINGRGLGLLERGSKLTYNTNPECYNIDLYSIPPDVPLYEPLGFRLDAKLAKRYNKQQSLSFNGYHSLKACTLEQDRAFGKQIAKRMGYFVPDYLVVRSLKDVPKKWFGRVAFAKLSKHYAIGKTIVSEESLKRLLKLARTWKDVLILETYIEYESEVNFCFHVNDLGVQPMCVLVETNKLLTNNTGGKTGTAWAYHQAITPSIQKNPLYQAALRGMEKLSKMGLGVCGWIDVSFLVTKDGSLLFSEFMVRHAVSNFTTLANQMRVNYIDFVREFNATGKTISQKDLWRTTHSASVELYSLPIDAAIWDLPKRSSFGLTPFSDVTVFDLLDETAQAFNGKQYVLQDGLQRFGVLSTCFDSKVDLLKHYTSTILSTHKHLKVDVPACFSEALNSFELEFPTIAYRPLGE